MMLTRLFVRCKTWRCGADICLERVPGFYFWGNDLRYEGATPLRVTCGACLKTHRYKLRHVTVRYGGDALGGVPAVVDP